MQLPNGDYLTIAEASQQTGYCEQYLRRLVNQEQLPGLKVGRTLLVHTASLEAYLEQALAAGNKRRGPRANREKEGDKL